MSLLEFPSTNKIRLIPLCREFVKRFARYVYRSREEREREGKKRRDEKRNEKELWSNGVDYGQSGGETMSFSSSRTQEGCRSQAGRLFSVHPERNLNLNGRSWSFIVGRGDTAEVRDGAREPEEEKRKREGRR